MKMRGGPSRVAPQCDQLLVHADWTAAVNLPQSPVHAQLVIRHPHVILIRLRVLRSDGLELGGGRGFDHVDQRRERELLARPQEEPLDVSLRDTSDRIDVR